MSDLPTRNEIEAQFSTQVGDSEFHRLANPGYVFKCAACGKLSRDNYGMHVISYGYDESCAMNCVLVEEK